MTKKQIRETKRIDLSDLEGKIDDMISQLQDWKNDGWEGLECDYYYESTVYELYKHRLETDEQYNLRMSHEKLMKERAEAQRRKQYEQLKREFGND
jgi:hypothetical protein